MNISKDLQLSDGSSLQWFKKDYNKFLNKTTLIYGRTQSGKSTIIDEIMYLCSSYISACFVICQSSMTVSSSPYSGKIPDNCIKSNVTKEWLEEFMEIQKGRATLYRTANDIKTLQSVFAKIKTPEMDHLIVSIVTKANAHIHSITVSNNLDYAQKKEQIDAISNMRNEELIKWYKNFIRKYKPTLELRTDLSSDEKCCVNYLDFNPNIMLIFDDCAASFKKWTKESEVITEMFYNGRHYFITQIISAQDDKAIDSELRKNALASIFTTSQAATANFTRASNSFAKETKIRAALCANRIFKTTAGNTTNYKKLVYLQGNNIVEPFAYIIADIYDNFKIGCDALWNLDSKINETNKGNDSNNAFFNKYHSN